MKFLNKKRVASAALAGALALSMAAPAFASQSVITGNYKEIRLAVTVPTTGKAVINPYGLPIALSETHNISGRPPDRPEPQRGASERKCLHHQRTPGGQHFHVRDE